MRIPAPVVEVVPISRLVKWEKNPRHKHAVSKIARSIEAMGYLAPIIVQKNTYRIVAGHGRLEALKVVGATEVPVIVAELTDDQADLYTLADNKLTEDAEWDFSILADLLLDFDERNLDVRLTGFSDREVDQIMNWAPGADTENDEVSAAVRPDGFKLVIKCRSEREQAELLARLQGEGFDVRAVTE